MRAYEPLFELASGGMATASIAKHRAARGFERLVIIKRIHPHLASQREFSDMFVDEARLASQIRGPHVVSVDDIVDDGGELFLVQPYVESVSLAALLEAAAEAGERLPPNVVSRVVGDALLGLESAHKAVDLRGDPLGIIHRDVSPANILVGTDGRSRVIDFGIAKAARRITVTKSGVLKGKVAYMAPEALRRTPIDARADVFAAGVVLYEALTGTRPFDGEDEGDTLLAILLGEPDPPSSRADGVPEAVDEIALSALAASRDDRFADAAAMHEALERAVPPAPPRDVAHLVERLLGAEVAARRERIRVALEGAGSKIEASAVADGTARPADVRARRIALAAALSLGLGGAWIVRAAPRVEAPSSPGPRASRPFTASLDAATPLSSSMDEAPAASAATEPSAPRSTPATHTSSSAPPRRAPAPKPLEAPANELHPNPYGAPR